MAAGGNITFTTDIFSSVRFSLNDSLTAVLVFLSYKNKSAGKL